MSAEIKKIIIILLIAGVGLILGRLVIRGLLNMLLGGTLFGGNIL